MMPEEGGYYIWVRETMGPFWGVQEAWWTMGYSIGLMASFPVLFVSYISFFIPAIAPGADSAHPGLVAFLRWAVALVFILTAMAVCGALGFVIELVRPDPHGDDLHRDSGELDRPYCASHAVLRSLGHLDRNRRRGNLVGVHHPDGDRTEHHRRGDVVLRLV